ncbi:hypothetical protein WDW89_26425 [Deltaproteobacteria bacterium TL4]
MRKSFIITLVTLILCLMGWAGRIFAQSSEEAPQILTTDLERRQKVNEAELTVSFVIYDDDEITQIYINDQPQTFEPGENVILTKNFTLALGRNLIKVVAIDEKANQREKLYLVAYGEGVPLLEEEEATQDQAKSEKLSWMTVFGVQYELDDNPTSDLSSPIPVGGIKLEGLVEDSDQPDFRTALNAIAILTYGKYNALIGANISQYAKPQYESLKSEVLFLGGGQRPKATDNGWLLNYMYLKINVGGKAFSQNQMVSLGYQFAHQAKNESNTKNTLSHSYTLKNFENAESGTQQDTKWEYYNLDKEKQDSFRGIFASGNGSAGLPESEFSYRSLDFDWSNKWTSGWLYEVGTGVEKRDFPKVQPLIKGTGIGDTRVDLPLRFSTALGWLFKNQWTLNYNFNYTFNLSNKKPYVRILQGLNFQGTF